MGNTASAFRCLAVEPIFVNGVASGTVARGGRLQKVMRKHNAALTEAQLLQAVRESTWRVSQTAECVDNREEGTLEPLD